jgi:hypothetical protein
MNRMRTMTGVTGWGGLQCLAEDAHHAGKHFMVYVVPSTLKPVGAVIMYDALGNEAAGG